jgi:tetratricopeptide (TPR) repeat protein
VETIRTLVADGRLVEEDGVYVPRGDLTTLAVPETLTALIAARLDTLDETDRRIVHDAAVLGQSFSSSGLSAVSEVPEADLEPRLASLVRRELLRREMDARSPERGQYAFVQALIREVAYNTLAKKDRKKLHLAAARHFESLGNEELAGALASHYLSAHSNSNEGAEADALASQARIALKAAAARALTLGAFDQAGKFYEQALTVTPDLTERADLIEQAADATRATGRYEHAEELLKQALDLRRKLGDRAAIVSTDARLGFVLGIQFKIDEQYAHAESVLEEFKDLGELPALDAVKLNLARAAFGRSEYDRPLVLVDEVLTAAELRDELLLLSRALILKSNVMLALGRRREGVGLTRLVREIAQENGLTDELLRATNNLAGHTSDVDVQASLELYREGLALARRAGRRDAANQLIGNIGYAGFLSGDWDYALSEIEPLLAGGIEPRDAMLMLNNELIFRASRGEPVEDGLKEIERLGRDMSGGPWRLFIADPDANAGLASGDLERAKNGFLEVAESDRSQASEYFYRAARPALWSRDLVELKRLAEAQAAAGGYGSIVAARRSTLAAAIAALEGHTADALALYREALRGWKGAGAVWDEALTGVDMAELLDPADPEVAEVIASTRAILERLRAKPYLERLEAAAAKAPSPRKARSRAGGASLVAEQAVTE